MAVNPMIAKIHIAKKDLGLDDDTYRDVLERVTGKRSSKGLGPSQMDALLVEFRKLGWKAKMGAAAGSYRKGSGKLHVRKIFAIWQEMCDAQIPAAPTRAGLLAFVQRMTKTEARPEGVADPEWLSPEEARKVIEALKAWRTRELSKRGR